MKFVFIKIEEWCGLWLNDELIYEHHDLTIAQLAEYTDKCGGPFELEVFNYPEGVESEFMEHGEFSAQPLVFWRSWAEEPERMRRER